MKDSRWNLWFRTSSWVSKYDVGSGVWTPYTFNTYIWSMYEDKRWNIWFGSDNSLFKYDYVNGDFTPYTGIDGVSFDGAVNPVFEDNDWNIWVTDGGGWDWLGKYNSITNQWTSYIESAWLENVRVLSINQDNNWNIWVWTRREWVRKYNPVTDQMDYLY